MTRFLRHQDLSCFCFPFFALSMQARRPPQTSPPPPATAGQHDSASPHVPLRSQAVCAQPNHHLACVICPRGTRLGQARAKAFLRALLLFWLFRLRRRDAFSPKPPPSHLYFATKVLVVGCFIRMDSVIQRLRRIRKNAAFAFAQNQTFPLLSPPPKHHPPHGAEGHLQRYLWHSLEMNLVVNQAFSLQTYHRASPKLNSVPLPKFTVP